MSNRVEISGLCKSYGSFQVLKNLDLSLEPGLFGLLGPNGAGKTTVMKILCTLLSFDKGSINIYGHDLQKEGEQVRRYLGYLPQQFNMPAQLTGEEFLHYVASMKGILDKRTRKAEVERALYEVNLQDKGKQKVKTYSGGMKQRLGIAQALLGNPSLIIVDEPTAGLDPSERIRFRNLIGRLGQERTIILSTHIVSDIEVSCDKVAVLNGGELQFIGNLQGLSSQAQGLVWDVKITAQEYEIMEQQYHVISNRREGSAVVLRVVSDAPPADHAVPMQPTVEDGYVALLKGITHG